MRRLRAFITTVAVVAICVVGQAVIAPAPASAAPNDPCEINSSYVGTSPSNECINGYEMNTRGRITAGPGCLNGRPSAATYIYRPAECGSGSNEYIGQARAIAYLDEKMNSGVGVDPNVQWEPRIQSEANRADILFYDRTQPVRTTPLQIIEAKGNWNETYADAPAQLQRYITAARAMGYTDVRIGTVLDGYLDEFNMYNGWCKTGAPRIKAFLAYMDPTPGFAGILKVEDTGKTTCQDGSPDPENPHPKPYPIPLPDPLPLPQPNPDPDPVPVSPAPTPDWACDFFCEVSDGWSQFLDQLADALAYGDPHLVTVDGLHYDLWAAGEFNFAQSPQYGLNVQARFVPVNGRWSAVGGVAMSNNGYRVEIRNDGTVLIDGEVTDLPTNNMIQLGDNAAVLRNGNEYYVVWPGEQTRPVLVYALRDKLSMISMYYPSDRPSDLTGLVGNANGVTDDDFKLRDGTQLSSHTSPATLHGTYADSWRITDATSLFTYGAGQSTATFTDKAFPPAIININSLTPSERDLGASVCLANGVPAGPQFDDCVLDIALTQNTDLALMAGERKTVAIDPNGAALNGSDLTVDYEANPLPLNFSPATLTGDSAATTFAGPFTGRSTYRFYVQNIPAHLTADLKFDLLAIGDWTADSSAETLTVQADRTTVWSQQISPSTMTPKRTGTLDDGQPFTVYAVDVPLTREDDQLEVILSAVGVDGLANEAFGVDNVALHVDVVAPQVFDVSLPFAVSNGVPAAGAGNLETKVSEDQYRFTMAAAGDVYVDVAGSCTPSISWKVVNATGVTAATGTCVDKRVTLGNAGVYRLIVTTSLGQTGTYQISAFAVPAPQVFPVTLPVSVANGVPGAGAGNLETKASQDEYNFTLAVAGPVYADILSCPNYMRWRIVDTIGNDVATGTCSAVLTPVLPAGAYRFVVTNKLEYTGAYSLKLTAVAPEATSAAAVDGPAVTVTTTTPGQTGRITFTGTVGQRVYTKISGLTARAVLTVENAAGDELGYVSCSSATCAVDTVELPATGAYAVVFNPTGNASGPAKIQLSTVMDDVQVAGAADGSPIAITTTAPGQNAAITFAGTQNSLLTVDVTNALSEGMLLRAPDGSVLRSTSFWTSSLKWPRLALPQTGTYRLELDPTAEAVGTQTVKLTPVPADATATAVPGGAAVTMNVTTSGQYAVASFAGAAGEKVSLTFPGSTVSSELVWTSPGGTVLVDTYVYGGSFVAPVTLPAAGTYKVTFEPLSAAVGTIGLRVHDVPADATATATVGGAAASVTTTVPGQGGRITFSGTAGQRVAIAYPGTTNSSDLTLTSPVGAVVQDIRISSATFTDPFVLPDTGTYTIVFTQHDGGVGTYGVRLYAVGADATATAKPGGAAVSVALGTPGQNGAVAFVATAGQRLSVTFPGTTTTAKVSVRKPDGTLLVNPQSVTSTSGFVDTMTMPVAGTYTLVVDGEDANVGTVGVQIFIVPADVTAVATPGGSAVTENLSTPGANGTVTFTGTAGHRVSLTTPGTTMSVTLTVKNPDGTVLRPAENVTSASAFFEPVTLPATGTYTIVVDGYQARTGIAGIRLYDVPADPVVAATVSGPAVTATTTVPGQNAKVTFSTTAGKRIGLSVTANSFSSPTFTLRAPDGTQLYSRLDSSTWSMDPIVMPAAGAYTLTIDPTGTSTGAATVAVTEVAGDVTTALPLTGTAVTATTTLAGQNAAFTFTGTAGRRVSFRSSANTLGFSPVKLIAPDGSTVMSDSASSSGDFFNPVTLPATGPYSFVVDPSGTTVGSITMQAWDVSANVTTAAPLTGAQTTLTTTVPGQSAVFTVVGTAGHRMSAVLSTVSGYADVIISKPDGTTLKTASASASGTFVDPLALTVTGTYTITFTPRSGATGAVSVKAYDVPADLTGTLGLTGTALTKSVTVPGQAVVATFAGTTGHRVSMAFAGTTVGSANVSIKSPSGAVLKSMTVSSTGFIDPLTLTATGTYTVTLTPSSGATGTVSAQAYDVPADLTGAVALTGVAFTQSVTVPGQAAVASFVATSGQRVSMTFTGTTVSSTSVTLTSPSGVVLKSGTYSSTSYIDPIVLTEAGTYTVKLDPYGAYTGTEVLKAYAVPADQTVATTIGGAAKTVTISAPGQNAVVTFTATAGQTVSFTANSVTTGYTTYTLRKPDGTTLASTSTSSATATIPATTLPVAGTYTILVDPSGAGIGNMSVKVS